MNKENYLSEALLKDAPKKKYSLIIKDGSVTASKLSKDVITEIASNVSFNVPAMDNEDIDSIMESNIEK